MKIITAIMLLAAMASAIADEIPAALKAAYMKEFPKTGEIDVVAKAAVGGIEYFELWGSPEPKGPPDGTEAAYSIAADGKIARIDGGIFSTLPCIYLATNKPAWQALQADYVKRTIQREGGREAVQKIIDGRVSMVYGLAESYREAGFTLPPALRIDRDAYGKDCLGTATTVFGK
jgi:hypothetical protein